MPILNYTTTIDAKKTALEIQYILLDHGATDIILNAENGSIKGISFRIETSEGPRGIKLPIRVNSVLKILENEKRVHKRSNIKVAYDQAERVALRIIKDWIEAQLALVKIGMVDIDEVFLPYLLNSKGETCYQVIKDNPLLLEAGKS